MKCHFAQIGCKITAINWNNKHFISFFDEKLSFCNFIDINQDKRSIIQLCHVSAHNLYTLYNIFGGSRYSTFNVCWNDCICQLWNIFVSINLSGNAQKCGLLAKPVLENCRRSVIFQNNVFSSLIRWTLEIRSMFHFIEWRIEVHACISYIAYNVYKELERVVPGLVSNWAWI